MSTTPKKLCSICQINEFKYSCPKCVNIKYCSIVCFTKHKEIVNNHEKIVKTPTPTESQQNVNNKNNVNTTTNTNTDDNNNENEDNEDNEEDDDDENDDDDSSMNIDEYDDEDEVDNDQDEDKNNNKEEIKTKTIKPVEKISKFTDSLSYFKKVTDEQFQMLDNSKYISSTIGHKKLQQLIIEVDEQPTDLDRIQLLSKYRKKIPEFNEFILKVLATIGNLDSLTIDDNGNIIKK